MPTKPRWDEKFNEHWTIGETGAQNALDNILEQGLKNYKEGRDVPSLKVTSRLSPHTHFGEISPHQIWHGAKRAGLEHHNENDLETFLTELGWREFCYYLLHHYPALPNEAWNKSFSRMSWSHNLKSLEDWQKGQTGYPVVDAGMRELWATGTMHNRVRMIVASFLVKHLQINWVDGQRWFWDCLVDADLAANAFNWQWVAGCGADAAPYFRIFNPVLQGEKFDKEGHYVRHWVPELKFMPNKFIHSPWTASQDILHKANVDLGKNYPLPMVQHNEARERALESYKNLKS